MTRKRGNPNRGKPDINNARTISPTSFEEIVRKLRLSPEDYQRSIPLKEWVQKSKDQQYVPSDLLKAWDFAIKEET